MLSSILAVMECRTTAWSKSVQHKMNITHLYHSSTGFYASLIILAVSTVPTMPGVRPLNHPAFLQWREAFRALRTRLHFDAPISTMLCHPCFEVMIVILLISKDRGETRKVVRIDLSEQLRCRNAIIQPCTGNRYGKQQAQRIDQQMPLAPFAFLAAVIPALGSSHLGGLDRWAIDAGGTGCWLTSRFHAVPFSQCLDQPGPCPVVTP